MSDGKLMDQIAPAEAEGTPALKPAPADGSRCVYVLWAVGLGLLLGLGLVCWLVVIPVLQVREALKRYSGIYDELPVDNPQEIERLGGPKEALRKLSLYLRLPRRMADHRAIAARMVSWCGQVAVPEAITLLKDQDDGVRSEAASAVGWPGDSRGLEALVKALGDKPVRLNATVALARIGDARAVPPLAALLGDRDDTVRRYAAAALGSMGKPAVEPLVASSGDRDEWVRYAVAWSLGEIRAPQSVQPLTALVKDRSSLVRVAAAWALGEIGPQANQAISELGEALHDKDAGVRAAAAEALKKIKGEEPPKP